MTDPSFSGDVAAALSDMRSSAKWLLGAFAATGAVIFAGLQLTSLGTLSPTSGRWRLPFAMIGFAFTILGIAVAIGAIGNFLRRRSVTAKDLVSATNADYATARDSLRGDPTILGEYQSIEEVWCAYLECFESLRADDDEASRKKTMAVAQALGDTFDQALTRATLVISSRRYQRALRRVAFGVAVAAAGAGTFAVAVAQPKSQQAQLPSVVRPATFVAVAIRPDAPDRSTIQRRLGNECDLNHLTAAVLEQTAMDTFALAVEGGNHSRAAELTVTRADAVVFLPTPAS